MLDLKFIRANPELVAEAMANRGEEVPLERLLELDEIRRKNLQEVEALKARRNKVSLEIATAKREGRAVDGIMEEMKEVSGQIKDLDNRIRELDGEIEGILLTIPNIPHPSIPVGSSEDDNVEIRRWGEIPQFDFPIQAHWDLGEALGILDFERGSKVAGARFTFLKGLGSRLERALINFMLDLHTQEHGYTELFPPVLANGTSMIGTGQLPKFSEDMFKCEGLDYYLIPTAEVPVTNYHRDEILEADQLPLYYVAYSPCFRAEAGAHGRDTRGLIRQHQFNKVELVKFVHPDESDNELEKLVANAETVLQKLKLPYRVVMMCTADVGFTAAKKYDPEVWMPSYNRYVEISSCSNFTDFQARRANVRFRPGPGQKPEYVHTLNGSGLAIGRTVAAILENYQQPDGSVVIPEVLRPYMGGLERIEKP
ncbi:MAG: serine--tRNA ligase [Limnochordia bacterium]|jgi:seryl-tRNA synthetase